MHENIVLNDVSDYAFIHPSFAIIEDGDHNQADQIQNKSYNEYGCHDLQLNAMHQNFQINYANQNVMIRTVLRP